MISKLKEKIHYQAISKSVEKDEHRLCAFALKEHEQELSNFVDYINDYFQKDTQDV